MALRALLALALLGTGLAVPAAHAVNPAQACVNGDCVTVSPAGVTACLDGACQTTPLPQAAPPAPGLPPAPVPALPPLPPVPPVGPGSVPQGPFLPPVPLPPWPALPPPPVPVPIQCFRVAVGLPGDTVHLVTVCTYDDNGDGWPDGIAVPVGDFTGPWPLWAGAEATPRLRDLDRDGVPDDLAVRAGASAGVFVPIPFCMPMPFIGTWCFDGFPVGTSAWTEARLTDPDGDGVPNRVVLVLPTMSTIVLTL